jgi:hypothetical protein
MGHGPLREWSVILVSKRTGEAMVVFADDDRDYITRMFDALQNETTLAMFHVHLVHKVEG